MKQKKIRVQFDFSKAALKRLDQMRKILDANSRAEVVRRALRMFDYGLEAEQGSEIIIRYADGTEEKRETLKV